MPRAVDHAQRRADVARAARTVIAREGLSGATVRRVAAELGGSTTAVTHYFASRDELLRAAVEDAYSTAAARMAAAAEAAAENGALAMLAAALEQALPIDRPARDEARIWIAFWASAVVSDELRRVQRRGYTAGLTLLQGVLREAAGQNELAAGAGPEHEAERLLLFVDGLTIEATLDPERFTADRQRALLAAEIARLRADRWPPRPELDSNQRPSP